MATYSINIGTPTESTKLNSLTDVLNKLPNNSAQLIKPRDVRDAIFTTWENSVFKFNLVTTSTIQYIGFNDTFSATRNKVLLGKNKWTTQETLNAGLLTNDVDHYFFNVKDDTNPDQDTKIAFLAGTDDTLYPNAPFIEANKITLPNRIDLTIANPSSGGIIELDSDIVELGQSGWVIDSGVLYPSVDGQSLGASPSNRIGTIYMSSTIDYLGTLEFVGTSFSSTIDDQGELTVKSIITDDIFVSNNFQLSTSATAGYVLKSDGLGNAIWSSDSFNATGITAGWVVKSDGVGNAIWSQDSFDTIGVTAGQILVADGLGGVGYTSPTTVAADGADGSIQFAEFGLLTSDNSNFYWNNTTKRLGIKTNTPNYDLDVNGDINGTNINAINITGFISSITTGSFSTLNTNNLQSTDLQATSGTFSNINSTNIFTSNILSTIGTFSNIDTLTMNAEVINLMDQSFSSSPATASRIGYIKSTINGTDEYAGIEFVSDFIDENFGEIAFKTNDVGNGGPAIERMRLTFDGRLGIGTFSAYQQPWTALEVSGAITLTDINTASIPVMPSDVGGVLYWNNNTKDLILRESTGSTGSTPVVARSLNRRQISYYNNNPSFGPGGPGIHDPFSGIPAYYGYQVPAQMLKSVGDKLRIRAFFKVDGTPTSEVGRIVLKQYSSTTWTSASFPSDLVLASVTHTGSLTRRHVLEVELTKASNNALSPIYYDSKAVSTTAGGMGTKVVDNVSLGTRSDLRSSVLWDTEGELYVFFQSVQQSTTVDLYEFEVELIRA